MDNNTTIDIHIDDAKKAIAHYVIEKNGVKQVGEITFSALVEQLNLSKEKEENLVRMPIMPDGFVGGEVHSDGSVTGTVAVHIPAAIQRMAWENGRDTIMVPYPSVILVYYLNNGRLKNTRAFAVKESNIININDNTVLYNYPYGNVSPMGGKVCWGSNRFERLEDFRSLNSLTNMFITSPTNADLYNPGLSTNKSIGLIDLVKQQSLRDKFDNSILKESGYLLKNIFATEK